MTSKDVASVLSDYENSIQRSLVYLIFLSIILTICIYAMFCGSESEHGNKGLEWFGAYATSVERGALITSIIPNSPAQKSGLMAGDIIVYVDREKINDAGSLKKDIINKKPNQRFNITVIRNGRWEVLSVRYGNNNPMVQAGNVYARGNYTRVIDNKNIAVVLIIFIIVFLAIFLELTDRAVIVGAGALAAIIMGTFLGFYDQSEAFSSINLGTLSLLLGMGLISLVLQEAGLFDYLSKRIIIATEGDGWKLMVFFCLTTYVFSCFVNNLTTILIIAPITLNLANELKFDPKPFVISEIISSNLGGASSMIGDFPNMLISSETGLLFHDFIFYMMPICLILLFVLLIYIKVTKGSFFAQDSNGLNHSEVIKMFEKINFELPKAIKNKTAVTRGLIILGIIIIVFIFSDKLGLPPAAIALTGGFTLLLISDVEATSVIKKFGFKDIIFFSGLFVLVGSVDASGFLDYLSGILTRLSGNNILAQCIILMWLVGILTSFLNAGPATMLFIPVIFSFGMISQHNIYWWSLSLGVLAGSSSLITGATAGQVASTIIEDYLMKNRKNHRVKFTDFLTFKEYAEVGVPIMFIFLLISSVYITLLYYI
ncbi:SLC13 family permease [candidate division KSB1 bacterium]